MRKQVIWPVLFGLAGAAILVSLGIWQLQRLAWKTAILDESDARIAAAPAPLPDAPTSAAHRYRPVEVAGGFAPGVIRVLVSRRGLGAGYRIISPFTTNGRRILVDRGIVAASAEWTPGPGGPVTVRGNLHWPDETDAFTPEDDVAGNTWFARDVARMAAHLGTEEVLVIARTLTPPDRAVTPLPVTGAGIPNNHLGYAVQWFGLALVWLGMTAFLVWRITRRTP